jgi:hypothetical protein
VKLGEIPSASEMQVRLQKEWGFKFQVAAEPLLEEMGYRIIRAQHRAFTSLGKRRKGWKWYMEILGQYLWNYADYVVMKGSRVYVVDVKSQGYVPVNKGRGLEPYCPGTVSFSELEKKEYSASRAPVHVLLVLYRWGGKIRKLPPGGLPIKGIVEYSEQPKIHRLGPLYYKLVPFSDFEFREGSSSAILANKFHGCKTLSSRNTYTLLRRVRAIDVVEIGPGRVTREKDGRRVIEGLSLQQ